MKRLETIVILLFYFFQVLLALSVALLPIVCMYIIVHFAVKYW